MAFHRAPRIHAVALCEAEGSGSTLGEGEVKGPPWKGRPGPRGQEDGTRRRRRDESDDDDDDDSRKRRRSR